MEYFDRHYFDDESKNEIPRRSGKSALISLAIGVISMTCSSYCNRHVYGQDNKSNNIEYKLPEDPKNR